MSTVPGRVTAPAASKLILDCVALATLSRWSSGVTACRYPPLSTRVPDDLSSWICFTETLISLSIVLMFYCIAARNAKNRADGRLFASYFLLSFLAFFFDTRKIISMLPKVFTTRRNIFFSVFNNMK